MVNVFQMVQRSSETKTSKYTLDLVTQGWLVNLAWGDKAEICLNELKIEQGGKE